VIPELDGPARNIAVIMDQAGLRRIVAEVVREEIAVALAALAPTKPAPDLALLTAEQLADLLHTDARSLRRLVHEGVIPPGIKLGDRRLRWRKSTIEALIVHLEKESSAGQGSTLTQSRSGRSVSSVKGHTDRGAASRNAP
jgi:hypothetical protein